MKPLEDIIREAAGRGNLNYLSVAHTDRGWEVAYRGVEDRDRRLTAHADPVCAILQALTGNAPPAPEPKRRRPSVIHAAPPPPASPFDDLLG